MRYFIIAGEASADLHASNLMCELKKQDSNADFCFLGGNLMLSQGGKMVMHFSNMAFMGFWAVLKNIRTIKAVFNICKNEIINYKPDVIILIDYPGFNLRLAKWVKKTSTTPLIYYISPKLWAWKEYRVKSIKKYIDKMYTIFPFETPFYAKHQYEVQFVGNPTVESIQNRNNKNQTFSDFCSLNNLNQQPIIALLPGSRKQEISACLTRMIESASLFDDYQIVIAGSPGIQESFYSSFVLNNRSKIVFGQTYELLQQASAAVVNSGTATLETALIGTPQVVVYHVMFGRLAMLLKPLVIKTNYISLVNIVAQKEIIIELVAHHFSTRNVTFELNKLLFDKNYSTTMKKEYKNLFSVLGTKNTSKTTAEEIIKFLKTK